MIARKLRGVLAASLLLVAQNLWADAVTITQSCDTITITVGNSVACTDTGTGFTRQNSYIRRFDLDSQHGIFAGFSVTSVRFAIESTNDGADTGQPVTVNLYSIPAAAPLLFANLTLVGTASLSQADTTLTFVDIPVTGTITNGTVDDLVVEIFIPDGFANSHAFFLGTNNAGQSAPSYNASPDVGCLGAEPADYAAQGFPNVHVIMEVSGDSDSGPAANSSCTAQEGKKAPEAICGKIFFSAQAKAEKSKSKAITSFVLDGCNDDAAADVGGELDGKLQPLAAKANKSIGKLGGNAECDPALQVLLPVDLPDFLDGAESGEDFLNDQADDTCDGVSD